MNTGKPSLHRRVATVVLLAASVPVAVALMMRPSPKPASLSDGFRACLVQPAAIVANSSGRKDIRAGSGSVLSVGAGWGKTPFRTHFTSGELLLELPQKLEVGTKIRFSSKAPPGLYREGRDGGGFYSETLEGTVEVLSGARDSVVFAIDMVAIPPVNDDRTIEAGRLVGKVRATRASSAQGCGGR